MLIDRKTPYWTMNTANGALLKLSSDKISPLRPSGTINSSKKSPEFSPLAPELTGLPDVEVFEHINFGGARWRTSLSYLYVGDWWNDKISSIIVYSGRWRFYQHIDFGGSYWDLGVGYHPWVVDRGIPNDIISSFESLIVV